MRGKIEYDIDLSFIKLGGRILKTIYAEKGISTLVTVLIVAAFAAVTALFAVYAISIFSMLEDREVRTFTVTAMPIQIPQNIGHGKITAETSHADIELIALRERSAKLYQIAQKATCAKEFSLDDTIFKLDKNIVTTNGIVTYSRRPTQENISPLIYNDGSTSCD